MDYETGNPSFHHGETGASHPSLFSDGDLAQPQPQPLAGPGPQLTAAPITTAPEDGVTFTSSANTPNAPIVNRQARNDDLANKALIGVVGTGIVLRKLIGIAFLVVFLVVFIIVVVMMIHGFNQANTGP